MLLVIIAGLFFLGSGIYYMVKIKNLKPFYVATQHEKKQDIGVTDTAINNDASNINNENKGADTQTINQENTKEETQDSQVSSCGMNLKVTGGDFLPTFCDFEIISSGASCGQNPCPKDYVIAMKDSNTSHIREITVFNFKSFEKATYVFNPSLGRSDFNGQSLDQGLVARSLLKGEVSLEPLANNTVRVSLDLYFANNIYVNGSGVLPVLRVDAP